MKFPTTGSRVSLRYRLSPGELTDVIGVLEAVTPMLLVRTKSDGVVSVAPDAVISVREIPFKPVRTSEIRALEHAQALAWPGTEQQWLEGWFLRAGGGFTSRANSAVPLDFSANLQTLPLIVDWYRERGLPAWLALPERLLPVRSAGVKDTKVLVRDASGDDPGGVELAAAPDGGWLATYERDVPVEVLTAVVDGELVFAQVPGVVVARGAVTPAPDGTRWLGISSVRVEPEHRRRGHARRVCGALLAWGAGRGAQGAYIEVETDNSAAVALYESMGFRLHHRYRYVEAAALVTPTI